MPQLPFPTEPVELALWLVGDAAMAEPWLPTTTERDARWDETCGERIRQHRGQHLAVRAQAGAPV